MKSATSTDAPVQRRMGQLSELHPAVRCGGPGAPVYRRTSEWLPTGPPMIPCGAATGKNSFAFLVKSLLFARYVHRLQSLQSLQLQGSLGQGQLHQIRINLVRLPEPDRVAPQDQLAKDSHNSGKPPSSDGADKRVCAAWPAAAWGAAWAQGAHLDGGGGTGPCHPS